jgi:hypothetical protein
MAVVSDKEKEEEQQAIEIASRDLEVSIALVDARLHKAIGLDQIVMLVSELLKETLADLPLSQKVLAEINEKLESISSTTMENGTILRDARKELRTLRHAKFES